MFVSQIIMAPLTNIELVSFFIIIIARKFGFKSLLSVYVFVGLEILYYGIAEWVVSYLYVWALFAVVISLMRRLDNRIVFTLVSGIFGLLFGVLCSPVAFAMGGFGYGISWIISGLRYDLLHCVGNLMLTFLLYKPLTRALNRVL